VRFGEVEQRGIALTPLGRQRYDELMHQTDVAASAGLSWQEAGRQVWEASDFPTDLDGLRRAGLAHFTYTGDASASASFEDAIASGAVTATPIVYEDFLPRSAAGIFQSNLTGDGTVDNERAAARYDINWLAATLNRTVHTPDDLYAAQSAQSLREMETSYAQ
jgi:uncharacterized glyoxalase superfamily metalloenzyme YdcJ